MVRRRSFVSKIFDTKRPIYFWEKIGFRIMVGFLLPLGVSAGLILHLNSGYTELNEAKDSIKSAWSGIRVAETKSLLFINKLRVLQMTLATEQNMLVLR